MQAAAAAVTVLDQPALEGLTAIIDGPPPSNVSDADCVVGQVPTAHSLAEDFVVATAVDVNQAVWLGGYDRLDTPAGPSSFTLVFHQGAVGVPGAAIATFDLVPAETSLFSGLVLGQPVSGYSFEARFAPVHFEPGTYWLEIFETDDTAAECFEWRLGGQDATRGRDGEASSDSAPGASWTPNLRSDSLDNRALLLASDLTAVEVPVLGVWGTVVLGFSLGWAGYARLNRR